MSTINPLCKFIAILLVGLIVSLSYKTPTNVVVCLVALALTLTNRELDYRKFFWALGPFILAAFGFFMTSYFFADSGR